MPKNVVTLKSGSRVLKVIETDTYWSATYDFLLTFLSNHGLIFYRFRDKRWFQSKIAKFSHAPRVFCAPADGVPLRIGYRHKGQRSTRMTALTDGGKSFKTDSCRQGVMPAENFTALNMLNNETNCVRLWMSRLQQFITARQLDVEPSTLSR